jgi:outer membrane cobalamin receptor
LDESESVRGGMAKAVGVLIDGVRHRSAGRGDHARGRALPRLVCAW